MATATPAYPHAHRGPALIVGTAPCVFDDLEQALDRAAGAAVIGLNEGVLVAECAHLFSLHHERLPGWREAATEAWGRTPTTHASDRRRVDAITDAHRAAIDHWWTGVHCGGTSAWGAVRLARALGYDPIILCGCPLNGGDGYAVAHLHGPACHQVGEVAPDHSMMRRYRERIGEYVGEGEGAGVYSMSGWTGQLLGAPP